jgi:hypothetical protein
MQIELELDTSPIGKLGSMPSEAIPKALSYAAQDMTRFLQMNSPVDHGLLKQWFIESLDDEEAHIKSPAEYAIYQDQGTKAHMIRPVNAKALHWEGGGFSKGHMVSGIKGKHFVDQSFNQLKPLVPGHFLRAFEEVQG